MADEIKAQCILECDNDNFHFPRAGSRITQITQTNPGGGGPGEVIAATDPGTSINVANLTAVGIARMVNIEDDGEPDVFLEAYDGTDQIRIGILKPGEPNQFRLDPALISGGGAYRLVSAAGGEKVQVNILEN